VSPSQLDPIDMEAWKLIQASVGLQCGGSWSNVEAMKVALAALSAPAVAAAARQRAEQLWARYGAGLGC
jgi:putative NIF3 family GTP cyclohydrolase 1 type 2